MCALISYSRLSHVCAYKSFNVNLGSSVAGSIGDGSAATSAQFVDPRGIALDTIGNIYISEYSGYRIRKVSISGVISTFAGIILIYYYNIIIVRTCNTQSF